MPTSYQAPSRGDDKTPHTQSQTAESNLQTHNATVSDILGKKGDAVYSIRPSDTLGQAVEILRDKRIGALMVRDDSNNLCGILSERDIVRKLADIPGQTLKQQVEDVMTKKVETCSPDETLVSILKRMSEGRFRHMPVVKESQLVGMVTIGDAVNYRLQELEYEALKLKQLIVG